MKILFGKGDNKIEKDYVLGPEPIVLEEAKDANYVLLNYNCLTYCRVFYHQKWYDAIVHAGKIKSLTINEVEIAKADFAYLNANMNG